LRACRRVSTGRLQLARRSVGANGIDAPERVCLRQLDRFERRGAIAMRRNRRTLQHKARVTRHDVAQRTYGLRANTENLVKEVRSII
jgi:hypothetical protein